MSQAEILDAVQGDALTCADAALSTALFEDVHFAEPLVMTASTHASPIVRGTAMICVGHLARLHKNVESSRRVLEVLRRGLADEDPSVRGKADDALGDVGQFVPSLRNQTKQLRG